MNKTMEANIAIKNAGLLNCKAFIPNDFITRMYLYASSATEQSSYFVKLAD